MPKTYDDSEPAFDSRQIGTILAALRYYQQAIEAEKLPDNIDDIASDFGTVVPLNAVDIDELCEYINTEDLRRG